MTSLMEDQCRIVAENWKKQDEVKQNALRVNSVKMEAHITKQEISFEEILPTVENFWSDTKTTEDSNDFDLQIILSLSSDTLKYALFHLGVNIRGLTNLKKHKLVMYIAQRWGNNIKQYGEITVANDKDGLREGVITYLGIGRGRSDGGGISRSSAYFS